MISTFALVSVWETLGISIADFDVLFVDPADRHVSSPVSFLKKHLIRATMLRKHLSKLIFF